MNVNKTLDEDIKEFGVYGVRNGRIFPMPNIQSKADYTHGLYDLHHFIKAQEYRRNRKWYEAHGIKQKLFYIRRIMHIHLESPMYELPEVKFWEVYGIPKSRLLFNKKKWIDEQVRKENEL